MTPPRLLLLFRPRLRRPLLLQHVPALSRHTRSLPLRRIHTTAGPGTRERPIVINIRRKKSILASFAALTSRAVFWTVAGIIMAAVPAYQAVNHILNPVDDAESLALYTPADEDARSKDAFIDSLPLVRSLRADPDFSESRPHLKIPPSWRTQNLTGGTLLGPGKVTVPPLSFAEKGGRSYVQVFHVGSDLCGHVGIVHGGFLATVLDEGLARCCFAALPHNVGLTASLEVNYKAPCKAEQYLVLKGRTTKVEGRKAWVEGHIETVPTAEGEEPVVLATAKALYISPRGAETLARVYPVS